MSTAPSNDLRPMPGERLYRVLLHVYPREFRRRYGESMVEFYRDRWRAEAHLGVARQIWQEILIDVVRTATIERGLSLVRALRRPRSAATARSPFTYQEDPMGTFVQDLRYALRGIAHRPGFTAVIVATLALGIGANAAIFSVVNGVLIRPLPFEDPDRIAYFRHEDPYWSVSEPEFMDYRRDVNAFSRLAAYSGTDANLTGDAGEPERIAVARISDGFFEVLGVRPLIGRTFTPDEEKRGGPPVVMISHGLWQRRFGADSGIAGKKIVINGTPRTVVGVMPPHFDTPSRDVVVWSPLRLNADSLWTRNNHYLQLLGRLAPGATIAQAKTTVTTLGKRWTQDFPETYFPGKPLLPYIEPIRDTFVGPTRPYLLALLGAVGFILLIACVNVANLLLARGESRRKELAIRTALGASGRRVVAQLLTESALLAAIGGAIGLLLAWRGVRVLVSAAPSSILRLDQVHVDARVLAFTIGVSLLTGVIFGLVPALRAAMSDTSESLKEGGKTSAHGSVRRARGLLVVVEVALAMVMLTGAGLLVRSLRTLQQTDLGFDPSNTLTMRLSLPPREYDAVRAVQFFRDLVTRVEALPGVRSAAAMGWTPMVNGGGDWSIFVDGKVVKTIAEAPASQPAQVTPAFFKTLGISMVRGRTFTENDRADAPMVVIVNEAMVRQLWPGSDPIGHTVKMFNDTAPWATVVGVARDIQSSGIRKEVPPTMFFPYAQVEKSAYYTPLVMTLFVKTTRDPEAVGTPIRQAVRALDRNVPVSDLRSMDDVVGASIASRSFSTMLLTGFASLALVLAGIGIYGVIAYGVSQRTYEIGLRMALGAEGRRVIGMVMSEGLRMTLAGAVIGLAGALGVARLIRSLLVGVGVVDVPTLVVVALVLLGVAVIASAVPARRAVRVSPTEALRNQ
jgi:predicted permease